MHHPPEADPHAKWFAEWQQLEEFWNGPAAPKVPTMADAPEGQRWNELFDLISQTPGTTLATAEAQLRLAIAAAGGKPDPREEEDASVRALRAALSTVEHAPAELETVLAELRAIRDGTEVEHASVAAALAKLAEIEAKLGVLAETAP